MMAYLIIYVLFLHWVADFVLQTDWMALNKSKCNKALTAHLAVYSLAMSVGLCYWGLSGLWVVLINGVLHWITDYVTSRINAKLWAAEQRGWFFVMIGFDQFIHAATLILLANHFLEIS